MVFKKSIDRRALDEQNALSPDSPNTAPEAPADTPSGRQSRLVRLAPTAASMYATLNPMWPKSRSVKRRSARG